MVRKSYVIDHHSHNRSFVAGIPVVIDTKAAEEVLYYTCTYWELTDFVDHLQPTQPKSLLNTASDLIKVFTQLVAMTSPQVRYIVQLYSISAFMFDMCRTPEHSKYQISVL